MSRMPRIQKVVLPLLRDTGLAVPDRDDVPQLVTVNTWGPDIDKRKLPMVLIRRVGGTRFSGGYDLLASPVIEMTVYTRDGLDKTEQLYEDALEALFLAVQNQTQTEAGYLHSIKESLGATGAASPFQDSWAVFGLIRLGLRPPRTQ